MIEYPSVQLKHGARIIAKPIDTDWGGSQMTLTSQNVQLRNNPPAEFHDYWDGSDTETAHITTMRHQWIELTGVNEATLNIAGSAALYISALSNSTNEITLELRKDNRHVIRIIAHPDSFTTIYIKGQAEHCIGYRQSRIHDNAMVNWVDLAQYAKSRLSHHDTLLGVGARCLQKTRISSKAEDRIDLSLNANHVAPKTKSRLEAKAVSHEQAQVILRGTVHMKKHSTGSESHQLLQTLNLGGESDAIPQLHIENNQVICSHKASVHTLDDDQLFYLTQRGIEPAEAKRIITEGFLQ